MKKALSILTAAALMSAMTASISAAAQQADEELNTFTEQSSDPQITAIGLDNAPTYTVTIPAKVTLKAAADHYENGDTDAPVRCVSALLLPGQKIKVVITAGTGGFLLKNIVDNEKTLAYKPYVNNVEIASGETVAQFDAAEQVEYLKFKTDDMPAYAGEYNDTVEFSVSLDPENADPRT